MKMPSVDEMLLGKQSRYSLVIAELKGDILVEKPVNLAIEDFKEHKYDIVEKDYGKNQ